MGKFEFKPHECGPDGMPHVKKANVLLERAGQQETFLTQDEVDEAWAAGWHDTGRPETADVAYEQKGENLYTMKKEALVELADKELGLSMDMSMGHKDMIESIKEVRKINKDRTAEGKETLKEKQDKEAKQKEDKKDKE